MIINFEKIQSTDTLNNKCKPLKNKYIYIYKYWEKKFIFQNFLKDENYLSIPLKIECCSWK